ncbi:hypothetical protein HYW17_00305 [Candidatus Uhrbacteria bacterium]|nr:hypothetical protein [Candidatus Uhrbacteria bacterium]
MKVIHTNDFERSFSKLPLEIQRLFTTQEQRFKDNWHDSRLHVKKVRGLDGAFSLRITRRYRAFFYFQAAEVIIIFDIDHRKDAYD